VQISHKKMYRLVMRYVLRLLVIFALAMSACAGRGVSEEDQASKIPEDGSFEEQAKRIPSGRYVSDEFRPALSLRLGEGWRTGPVADYSYGDFLETSTNITLSSPSGTGPAFLEFLADPKVYKVISSYEAKAQPAPEDLVSWLQNNPYLDTEKPQEVSVGGVKGKQFDAVAARIPQEYVSRGYHATGSDAGCAEDPCLPLFQVISDYGDQSAYELHKDDKVRFIILDDVNGKSVTIAVLAPTVKFDEFWPKAQQVLKTVGWKGT